MIAGVVGLAVALAGAWWFLSNRGVVRWLAAGVAIAAPVFVIVLYISRRLLWAILLVIVLTAISAAAGRAATVLPRPSPAMPERQTNPRAGRS